MEEVNFLVDVDVAVVALFDSHVTALCKAAVLDHHALIEVTQAELGRLLWVKLRQDPVLQLVHVHLSRAVVGLIEEWGH